MVTCFGGAIFAGTFCGGSIGTEGCFSSGTLSGAGLGALGCIFGGPIGTGGWLSGPLVGAGFSTFGFCLDCSAGTWTREAVALVFAGSLPCRKLLTLWDLHRACATYACPQMFVAIFAKLGLEFILDNRALDICSRNGGSSGIENVQ